MKTLFVTIVLLIFSVSSGAHPVIYKGGYALSSSNMPDYSENYLMYSFTERFATGLAHWRFSRGDEHNELGMLKLNHLLVRHNGEDSQANVYLHGGIGLIDQSWDPRDTRESYMAGVEADWETRKLYTSLKHYQFHTPAFSDISMTQGRVGFSPVLADFKDLQTWVMLQGMYTPDINRTVSITPLLRLFYHNVLWEMGASTQGQWLLNFMVHY